MSLKYKKLSPNATAPTRGTSCAIGIDLYSAHDVVVLPGDRNLCKTDLQLSIPEGCYGRIAPRSGLALQHGIDVGAGVIDRDYRGNVGVLLFNFGKEPFNVKKGDRIAQLICEKILFVDLKEEETLDETERGTGGFGSTGITTIKIIDKKYSS